MWTSISAGCSAPSGSGAARCLLATVVCRRALLCRREYDVARISERDAAPDRIAPAGIQRRQSGTAADRRTAPSTNPAFASQVQVLRSVDLIKQVAREMKLHRAAGIRSDGRPFGGFRYAGDARHQEEPARHAAGRARPEGVRRRSCRSIRSRNRASSRSSFTSKDPTAGRRHPECDGKGLSCRCRAAPSSIPIPRPAAGWSPRSPICAKRCGTPKPRLPTIERRPICLLDRRDRRHVCDQATERYFDRACPRARRARQCRGPRRKRARSTCKRPRRRYAERRRRLRR